MQKITTPRKTVYDLLDRIQKDPRDYLPRRSLDSLADFLLGFAIAQRGAACGHYKNDGEPPFHDFTVWFRLNRGALNDGWYPAIMTEAGTSKDAFDHFFKCLTAYRNRVLKFRYSFAISPDQQKYYATRQKSRAPKQLRLIQYAGEKCVFVQACWRARKCWQYHCGFRTLKDCQRGLAGMYGITLSQWKTTISTGINKIEGLQPCPRTVKGKRQAP